MTGDPDLDQACEDLVSEALRLRELQSLAARGDQPYSTLTARSHELADAEEAFALRGERLRMHADRRLAGRALLLVVEEAHRLRVKMKRRPTGPQLADAVKSAVEAAERDRVEAEAEYNVALLLKARTAYRAASSAAALQYMKASR